MKKMKAFVKKNKISNQFVFQEILVPEIAEDQILVKIKAVGVGIQDGYFFPLEMDFPYPIGMEGSGVIKKVGKDIVDFNVGDRICFVGVSEKKGGAYAEYMVLSKQSLVIKIPDTLSFIRAAAIPMAASTMAKVFNALSLKRNDSIFIAGASGSNGTLAIQLAKKIGCKISASSSKNNHKYMKSLGVVMAVDYNDEDWTRQILEWKPHGVDAAIAIQPNTSFDSMKVVKDHGKILSVSSDNIIPVRGIKEISFPYAEETEDEVVDIINKIVANEIEVTIENIYSFEDADLALKKVRTRKARGKSVIKVS